MAAGSSFDIVSKVDRQEADNALQQAAKELAQRFDFRGTETTIRWQGEHGIDISSSAEERARAALDVLKDKLVKRGVSLKALDAGDPRASGRTFRISATLKEGIDADTARRIGKLVRDAGPKGVQAQVQGDSLRVTAKKKDDLQAVIALVKAADLDVALQFTNYR